MAVRFGPLGDSKIFSVSSTSSRTALPTLPTDATSVPAVALVSLQPQQAVWWVKFGDNTVTASITDAIRCEPGSKESPLILPVVGSHTHIAILAEGESGDLMLTGGELVIGDFSPSGTGSQIAVTQSTQTIALPTLPSVRPAIALVAMQAQMEAIWVKFGNGSVTGSITTSMRVFPGSSNRPTLLKVPAGATHLAIFCDGSPGGVIMTPGSMALRKVSATADIIMSASPRILGLDTGHPAPAKELTLSQVLDFVGSATQGDVLIRGSATWERQPGVGKQSIWLEAVTRIVPRSPSPAGSATIDSGSNDNTFPVLDFDQTTFENARFSQAMPKSWDLGSLSFTTYWTANGGSAGQTFNLIIGVKAVSDGDDLNFAGGTLSFGGTTDTLIGTNLLHISPESSPFAISNAAQGDMLYCQLFRNVDGDNLAADARVLGIMLHYTTNALTDI